LDISLYCISHSGTFYFPLLLTILSLSNCRLVYILFNVCISVDVPFVGMFTFCPNVASCVCLGAVTFFEFVVVIFPNALLSFIKDSAKFLRRGIRLKFSIDVFVSVVSVVGVQSIFLNRSLSLMSISAFSCKPRHFPRSASHAISSGGLQSLLI